MNTRSSLKFAQARAREDWNFQLQAGVGWITHLGSVALGDVTSLGARQYIMRRQENARGQFKKEHPKPNANFSQSQRVMHRSKLTPEDKKVARRDQNNRCRKAGEAGNREKMKAIEQTLACLRVALKVFDFLTEQAEIEIKSELEDIMWIREQPHENGQPLAWNVYGAIANPELSP